MAMEPLAVQRALARKHLPGGDYISIDRSSGRRCLHCLACYRTPAVDFDPWTYLGTSTPGYSDYDRFCKTCFGMTLDEQPADEAAAAQGSQPSSGAPGAIASDDDFTSDSSDEESVDAR